jgi:hypothetical protein
MHGLARGALVVCLFSAGCATTSAPTATPTPTVGPSTPTASPTLAPNQVIVPARANIFGAGRDEPPEPGGGGAGVLPPAWSLPDGLAQLVTVPSITGQVNPVATGLNPRQPNGPGGDLIGPTNIESYDGISGIVHAENGMFLVGVFLTDDEPTDPAPERLDFTDNEDFELLEPQIGQTFLIGDGVGRRFLAPSDATRLFLGFADAAAYQGPPGYYDNNSGQLLVTMEFTSD